MGMFDWVEIKQELLINIHDKDKVVQTKTLDCTMARYRLHDNKLFRVRRKMRRTDQMRWNPIFNRSERVVEQIDEREEQVKYHGDIYLTAHTDTGPASTIILRFSDGELVDAWEEGWQDYSYNEQEHEDPDEWWEG